MANIQFEDILPWGTTGGDTGLSSRLKLKRNFEKIRLLFSQMPDLLADCTAWGQPFWHNGPASVSGTLQSVADIEMTGALKMAFGNSWFEQKLDANGDLQLSGNVYALGAVSCLGVSAAGTDAGGSGATALSELSDTAITLPMSAGQALVFDAGKWRNRLLTWSDLSGKPTAFTPSAHTHVKADITDFAHTHVKADITDFAHTHVKADITDFPTSWAWSAITGKPSTFAPSAHSHVKADITDFPTSWAWSAITGKPSTFTPSAHSHVKADITDFPTTWPWSAISGKPTTWAWSAITGKPTTLSGYGITDAATAAQMTAATGRISTLEGYFDGGVANSAKRLSGSGSFTAWGRTFWNDGVPQSVSGNLTGVGTIYFTGSGTPRIFYDTDGINIYSSGTNYALYVYGGDLYADENIMATGAVSCLGTSAAGSAITGAAYLRDLLDVQVTGTPTTGHVLTFNGTNWVPQAAQGGDMSAYATKDWVGQQSYATQRWVYDRGFAYNADLQDLYSYNESAYVKALGTSGDYLTWTRNGATNNLTVPFATDSKALRNFFDSRPASANNQYGDGNLRHYMATSSMTTGKPTVDAHIIHSAWDYNNGYDAQLAIGNANSGLFFRTQSQGTWQAWKQVAILDNLSGYLPLSAGSGKPLTGELYISGSHGIQWNNGEGMLVCRPTAGGWAGVSETQWAVGALTAQGVIRSDANDLLHCRSNTAYKVWDAYNFNPGNYLPLTGGTLKGDLVLGNQNNTTNDDSAKIAFRTNDTYPNISPYIQAINEANYGRKRLSVFQKNAEDWSSPQVEVLSVMPDGKLRLTQAIAYKGTKATHDIITFIDNTADIYGNGIAIGGGGATIIGGGESASVMASQLTSGGNELMYIGNDQGVSIFTNLQNGWDYRKEFTFYNTGVLSTAGSVITPNGSGLYIEDTGGTERIAVFLNNSNQFFVGFGIRNAGYTGYFDSYVMHLRSGASGTTMTLDANNRVGIGTTAPDYKLDVAGAAHLTGDASGYGLILDNDKAVTLKDSGGTLHRALFLNAGNLLSLGYGTTRNSGLHTELCGRTITFKTGSGGGTDPVERVRITETGNVGIGTASPQHRLHVAGNIVATGAVAAFGVSAQGTAIGAIAADTLTVSQSAVIGGAATVGGRLSVAMSAAVRGNVELQDGSTIYWGGTMGDDPAIYMSDGHIYARAGGGNTVQLV